MSPLITAFIHSVRVQNWSSAADQLNGMSMTDILTALSALGSDEITAASRIVDALKMRGWVPNAERIAWAASVVSRGTLAPPPSSVPPAQVAEAQRFLSSGGQSKADIAGDEVTQDVWIEIGGMVSESEAGRDTTASQVGFENTISNQPGYARLHGRLISISFNGGFGASDPSARVIKKFEERTKDVKSFGRIIVLGTSAGGRPALKVACDLTKRGIDINYVGLSDPAFDNENDPMLSAGPIKANEKEAFFQTWGYTIDPAKEYHGCPAGFRGIDLTDIPGVKQAKADYEAQTFTLDREKGAYAFAAHEACGKYANMAFIYPKAKMIVRP